jgi:Ca2+-binding RTX toxin-like protein
MRRRSSTIMGAGGSAVNVLLANDGNDTLVATVQAGTLGSNRLFGHNGNDRLQVGGGDGNLLNAGQAGTF